LEKKSPAMLRGFQKRYCVLDPGMQTLEYYKEDTDPEPAGGVDLKSVVTLTVEGLIFSMTTVDRPDKPFVFRTESAQVLSSWVKALQGVGITPTGDDRASLSSKGTNAATPRGESRGFDSIWNGKAGSQASKFVGFLRHDATGKWIHADQTSVMLDDQPGSAFGICDDGTLQHEPSGKFLSVADAMIGAAIILVERSSAPLWKVSSAGITHVASALFVSAGVPTKDWPTPLLLAAQFEHFTVVSHALCERMSKESASCSVCQEKVKGKAKKQKGALVGFQCLQCDTVAHAGCCRSLSESCTTGSFDEHQRQRDARTAAALAAAVAPVIPVTPVTPVTPGTAVEAVTPRPSESATAAVSSPPSPPAPAPDNAPSTKESPRAEVAAPPTRKSPQELAQQQAQDVVAAAAAARVQAGESAPPKPRHTLEEKKKKLAAKEAKAATPSPPKKSATPEPRSRAASDEVQDLSEIKTPRGLVQKESSIFSWLPFFCGCTKAASTLDDDGDSTDGPSDSEED